MAVQRGAFHRHKKSSAENLDELIRGSLVGPGPAFVAVPRGVPRGPAFRARFARCSRRGVDRATIADPAFRAARLILPSSRGACLAAEVAGLL